jgi:hypothetical protein
LRRQIFASSRLPATDVGIGTRTGSTSGAAALTVLCAMDLAHSGADDRSAKS